MPDWATFAGLTAVVLLALLALARSSASYVTHDADAATDATGPARSRDTGGDPDATAAGDRRRDAGRDHGRDRALELTAAAADETTPTPVSDRTVPAPLRARDPLEIVPDADRDDDESTPTTARTEPPSMADLSTGVLLANVAFSQGVFALVLVLGAWYTRIPLSALGVETTPSTLATATAIGIGVGLLAFGLNAAGAAALAALGIDPDERLRTLLTPASRRGWAGLLGVVLPLIAGFEELLFRGALIGVPAAGFGLPPWPLAIASSIAFGLGHGAQGRAGILVTGVLGFGLAAAYVLTGSLIVVIVAHYLVNALEFVLGGYFGLEWS